MTEKNRYYEFFSIYSLNFIILNIILAMEINSFLACFLDVHTFVHHIGCLESLKHTLIKDFVDLSDYACGERSAAWSDHLEILFNQKA